MAWSVCCARPVTMRCGAPPRTRRATMPSSKLAHRAQRFCRRASSTRSRVRRTDSRSSGWTARARRPAHSACKFTRPERTSASSGSRRKMKARQHSTGLASTPSPTADTYNVSVDAVLAFGGTGDTSMSAEAVELMTHIPADWQPKCFESFASVFMVGVKADILCNFFGGERSDWAEYMIVRQPGRHGRQLRLPG